MKVLLLNQVFYPDRVATAQHTLDLARHLTRKGCQVTVVASRRNYENPSVVYPRRETFEGIEIYRVGSTGFGKRSFFHRFIDAITLEVFFICRLLLLPSQDFVVSFTSPPLVGFLGIVVCALRGGQSVQWLMDINPDIALAVGYLKRGTLVSRFLTAVLDFTLRKSDFVVVLDTYMKKVAVSHGAEPAKVTVIPPWPVHSVAQVDESVKRDNPFRKQHGLDGKFVVLYSGNHSVVHPLDTLLEAALRLRDDPGVVFLFIGGGLRVPQVKEFKERHQLANIMQLAHQPREMLPFSLSSADLHVVVMGEAVNGLVHTSKVYGILATGTPYLFIGPRASHIGDLLAECPYGFHAEHGQPGEILSVIARARALTPAQIDEYARENTRYVSGLYTAEKCMDLFATEVLGLSTSRLSTVNAGVRAAQESLSK